MTWTLTTSGAAIAKAGAGQSWEVDTKSGAYLNTWNNQAEGRIEAETRRKWVDNYSNLPTGIKNALDGVASSLIGMNIIGFDMSGYTSRQEAQLLLDINDDIVNKGMQILKDFKSNELKDP